MTVTLRQLSYSSKRASLTELCDKCGPLNACRSEKSWFDSPRHGDDVDRRHEEFAERL